MPTQYVAAASGTSAISNLSAGAFTTIGTVAAGTYDSPPIDGAHRGDSPFLVGGIAGVGMPQNGDHTLQLIDSQGTHNFGAIATQYGTSSPGDVIGRTLQELTDFTRGGLFDTNGGFTLRITSPTGPLTGVAAFVLIRRVVDRPTSRVYIPDIQEPQAFPAPGASRSGTLATDPSNAVPNDGVKGGIAFHLAGGTMSGGPLASWASGAGWVDQAGINAANAEVSLGFYTAPVPSSPPNPVPWSFTTAPLGTSTGIVIVFFQDWLSAVTSHPRSFGAIIG